MAGVWVKLGWAVFFAAILGCAPTRPNLRPTDQKEVLNVPPDERRYNDPNEAYPKQAFQDRDDPSKRFNLANGPGATGGPGSRPGMGMSPGGR